MFVRSGCTVGCDVTSRLGAGGEVEGGERALGPSENVGRELRREGLEGCSKANEPVTSRAARS